MLLLKATFARRDRLPPCPPPPTLSHRTLDTGSSVRASGGLFEARSVPNSKGMHLVRAHLLEGAARRLATLRADPDTRRPPVERRRTIFEASIPPLFDLKGVPVRWCPFPVGGPKWAACLFEQRLLLEEAFPLRGGGGLQVATSQSGTPPRGVSLEVRKARKGTCPAVGVRCRAACPVSGVRRSVFGVRRFVSGARCPVLGIWCAPFGVSCGGVSL